MTIDIIKRALLFVVLCLLQALVLNHVNLFGCATPLLYVFLPLTFPHRISRSAAMLWAFFLGVTIDFFSNTPGMAAAALTLVAAIQPTFFSLFLQHDAPDDLQPSAHTMGLASYTFFTTVLVFIHCFVLFTLEAFSFFNWWLWLKSVVGSTLITTIIIITIEAFRRK